MIKDIPLTLPGPLFWVAVTLLGILALSTLIFWATTPWQAKDRSDEPWTLRALNIFGLILALPWALLICATAVGLWNTLLHSPFATTAIDARWNALAIIGHITALLALISAPLALIRVYTTERQTRTAEQGHMTDRISKAVEHLGAEKTVKTLGKDENGKDITLEETKPNIEVRIGGLLSLERISQDSVKYDNGRDHVRVMEILCAYVRENAKAEDAKAVLDVPELKEDTTPKDAKELWETYHGTLPPPREDITTALNIIGRRDADQLRAEARWGKATRPDAEWVFTPAPPYPGGKADTPPTKDAITAYEKAFAKWQDAQQTYRGYRPDLRGTNLQKTDLSEAVLAGARLTDAQLQGADLIRAQLQGAYLGGAQLQRADLSSAEMDMTTILTAANVSQAAVRMVDYTNVRLSPDQVKSIYGDASVILPGGVTPQSDDWPEHWPRYELDWNDFLTEWRKWQDDPENYRPRGPSVGVPPGSPPDQPKIP